MFNDKAKYQHFAIFSCLKRHKKREQSTSLTQSEVFLLWMGVTLRDAERGGSLKRKRNLMISFNSQIIGKQESKADVLYLKVESNIIYLRECNFHLAAEV